MVNMYILHRKNVYVIDKIKVQVDHHHNGKLEDWLLEFDFFLFNLCLVTNIIVECRLSSVKYYYTQGSNLLQFGVKIITIGIKIFKPRVYIIKLGG